MSPLYKNILLVVVTVFVTASVIYLTPLKWINVIEPTIKDIDPQEFYVQYQKDPDHFIFLDVRSETSYNKVHAKGSLNVPLHTLYDVRHVLPKSGKEIVLICSLGRASGVAYSYLQHYGFFNIERIAGGIEQWIAVGLPTEGTDIKSAPSEAFLQSVACRA